MPDATLYFPFPSARRPPTAQEDADGTPVPGGGELTGQMEDGRGRLIQFAHAYGLVLIQVTPHSGHHGRIALATREQQAEFGRLYAAAQAAAQPPEETRTGDQQ